MVNICFTQDSDYENVSQKRIENIVKVFLDGVPFVDLSLSFLVLTPKTNEIKIGSGEFTSKDSRILSDVPIDEPMWAIITPIRNPKGNKFSNLYGVELHVHSGEDIEKGSLIISYYNSIPSEGF